MAEIPPVSAARSVSAKIRSLSPAVRRFGRSDSSGLAAAGAGTTVGLRPSSVTAPAAACASTTLLGMTTRQFSYALKSKLPGGLCLIIIGTEGCRLSQSLRNCSRAPGEAGAIQPVEREGGSARPVASVAGSSVTVVLKRTQRDEEDCIELQKILPVEAGALRTAAGNMHETVLRGAPPESETSSSRQGSCRNLGDLRPPAAALAGPGRFGKARSRSRTGRSEEAAEYR